MHLSELSLALRPLLVGVLLVASTLAPRAHAYTPEDPEVLAMVDRAVKYLEGLSEQQLNERTYGVPEGQPMLIAYAHFKAMHDPDAPLVKLGIQKALQYVETVRKNNGALVSSHSKAIYESSVAIMLLAEVDSRKYRPELSLLASALLARQMAHGGFGYFGMEDGDTSQVQYAALAMWTLDRAGIEFNFDQVSRMNGWIMRVQDPTGYWTYTPKDPGPGRGLVNQTKSHLSVTTCLAAGSAVLIAADVLRQWGVTDGLATKIEGLPAAVKVSLVDPTQEQQLEISRKKAIKVPAEAILAALNRMDNYRTQNPFKRTGAPDWYYYMIYTLERYESFLEIARPSRTPSNAWYDEGVESLMKLQDASGAWGASDASLNSAPVSTAFAVLFLIRSTKRAIATASQGTVAGGYKLPDDTSKIVVSGTQIKGEPVAAAVTDLLSLLEEGVGDQFDQQSIPEDLQLEKDPARRRQQLDRLERLVRGSRSWQARRVAAKLLGTSDDLSVVPSLIYALSDPDTVVRRSAVEGLRFISRRFNDFDMPDKPDAQEIRKAQQQWRQWYQSIYPGYVFLDAE